MPSRSFRLGLGALAAAFLALAPALAADDSSTTAAETIQVTATRLPEDVEPQPSSITVISGEELAARGITDLTEALTLVAGVSAVPGGDGGPAGSVPEIWGLKEFDAFLLVVDGVPWGGAFNPDLTTLDLNGVERIEVLRGPAPVMYGATSFVGVIHVIHRAAGVGDGTYSVSGGSFSSGAASVATSLPSTGSYRQSIQAGYQKQGFKDDRTDFDRAQVLYRGEADAGGGKFHFDLAATLLDQSPASPHPRQGPRLSTAVPLDANHNPSDAKLDEDRYHLVGGYDTELAGGAWSTTLSYTHSQRDVIRGFLTSISNTPNNARGFEQDLSVDDLYFESHWSKKLTEEVQLVTGLDVLAGKGKVESEIFDYTAPLNGHGTQSSSSAARLEETETEDERNFSGLFAQLEWNPTSRFKVEVGLRANRAEEKREAEAEPIGEEPGEEEGEEGGEASDTITRGSGVVGASYLLWTQGDSGLWAFADIRDTFKPSAIDFGPEAEGGLLKPEEAQSWEVGLKGRNLGGRLFWQVSGFQMDFENLVTATIVNGLPALINAGSETFEGVDAELSATLPYDLRLRLAGAWHDATFDHFTQEFDGVPTVLDGNRLEMSANESASAGLFYVPDQGFLGEVEVEYVGDYFLNKRNTALSPSYTTWSAGVGYRFSFGEIRVEGLNLSDERPPVAESEFGDAQYYRLPARSVRVTWRGRF